VDRDEARAAALLDRRTTALATRGVRRPAQPETAARPLILWSLGESLFGTEVGAVAAVIPFAGCARVPTREAACLGVIGRAGRFYSVIGMRRLLGLGPGLSTGERPPGHLLLLRGAPPYLALAVDRVLGRFDLTPAGPTGGPAFSFEGRLVAPFSPTALQARLGPVAPAIRPLESMPP
jgi:chemotaxis signal transduction protein